MNPQMAHTERAGTGAGVGVGAATDTTDCSLCGWWFPRAQEDTLADLQACLETEYGMIAAVLRDRLSTAASSWALPFSTVHCAATLSNFVADNCLRADLVDVNLNRTSVHTVIQAAVMDQFRVLHATATLVTDPRPPNVLHVFVPSPEAQAIQEAWHANIPTAVAHAVGLLRRAMDAFCTRLVHHATPAERGILGGEPYSCTLGDLAGLAPTSAASAADIQDVQEILHDGDDDDDDDDDGGDDGPQVDDIILVGHDDADDEDDHRNDMPWDLPPVVVNAPLTVSPLQVLLGRWAPVPGCPTLRTWRMHSTASVDMDDLTPLQARAMLALQLVLRGWEEAATALIAVTSMPDGPEAVGKAAARLFGDTIAKRFRDTVVPDQWGPGRQSRTLLSRRNHPRLVATLAAVFHLDLPAARRLILDKQTLAPSMGVAALRMSGAWQDAWTMEDALAHPDLRLRAPFSDVDDVVHVAHVVQNVLTRMEAGIWEEEVQATATGADTDLAGALGRASPDTLLLVPPPAARAMPSSWEQIRACLLMALHLVYSGPPRAAASLHLPHFRALCAACSATDRLDIHLERATAVVLSAVCTRVHLPDRLLKVARDLGRGARQPRGGVGGSAEAAVPSLVAMGRYVLGLVRRSTTRIAVLAGPLAIRRAYARARDTTVFVPSPLTWVSGAREPGAMLAPWEWWVEPAAPVPPAASVPPAAPVAPVAPVAPSRGARAVAATAVRGSRPGRGPGSVPLQPSIRWVLEPVMGPYATVNSVRHAQRRARVAGEQQEQACRTRNPAALVEPVLLRGHLAPLYDTMLLLTTISDRAAPAPDHTGMVNLRLLPAMALVWHMGRVLRADDWEGADTGAPADASLGGAAAGSPDDESGVSTDGDISSGSGSSGSSSGSRAPAGAGTDTNAGGSVCYCCCSRTVPAPESRYASPRMCPTHALCTPCLTQVLEAAAQAYLASPFCAWGTPAARAACRAFCDALRCKGSGCSHGHVVTLDPSPYAWEAWLPQELAMLAASACAGAAMADIMPSAASVASTDGTTVVGPCSFCGAAALPDVVRNREWQPWHEARDGALWWCGRCGGHTCNQCGRHGHPGTACTCGPRAAGVRPEDLLAAAKIQHCPGCKLPTVKNLHCNHMTCSQCTAHWCWACGSAVDPRDPGHHFAVASPACVAYSLATEVARMRRTIQGSGAPPDVVACALTLLHDTFAQDADDL